MPLRYQENSISTDLNLYSSDYYKTLQRYVFIARCRYQKEGAVSALVRESIEIKRPIDPFTGELF